MDYDYGIPGQLLRFLGACLYGDAAAYHGGLTEAERAELEAQEKCFGMAAWTYRYLHDVLPEEKKAAYQRIFQSRQIKAMSEEEELKRLCRVLTAHGLRFTLIKGADLAYRLYPDAALRPFRDWDIWFHPDDCDRALAVLAEDGWTVPERFTDNNEFVRNSRVHHFSPHIRGQCFLEPHFTLMNFKDATPHEMWEYTEAHPGGNGQRVLSPEMNILMLACHASARSYYHAQIPKLLTDAAVLMQREKVDFAKLREMAERWHLPYPGDLLAAFPEFFPADVMVEFHADPQKKATFRKLFELRGELGEQNSRALQLNRHRTRGKMIEYILEEARAITPERIRVASHLPRHNSRSRMAWASVRYYWERAWHVLATCVRRDHTLQEYIRLVEEADSGLTPPDGSK